MRRQKAADDRPCGDGGAGSRGLEVRVARRGRRSSGWGRRSTGDGGRGGDGGRLLERRDRRGDFCDQRTTPRAPALDDRQVSARASPLPLRAIRPSSWVSARTMCASQAVVALVIHQHAVDKQRRQHVARVEAFGFAVRQHGRALDDLHRALVIEEQIRRCRTVMRQGHEHAARDRSAPRAGSAGTRSAARRGPSAR